MINWTLYLQIILAGLLLVMLLRREQRPVIVSGIQKVVENATSKRFITLMIATWFVYKGIPIDGNWLVLAGVYIGLDTANNAGVFSALADKFKSTTVSGNAPDRPRPTPAAPNKE